MSWKSWPYWVKGGSIGAVYSLIVFVLAGILEGGAAAFSLLFLNLPAVFILGVFLDTPLFAYENILLLYAAMLLTNAVVFAFVGYLYGKFRNRKHLDTGSPPSRG